jgi:hypothetical protein
MRKLQFHIHIWNGYSQPTENLYLLELKGLEGFSVLTHLTCFEFVLRL